MAIFNINSINYITTGKTTRLINLNVSNSMLENTDNLSVLAAEPSFLENSTSALGDDKNNAYLVFDSISSIETWKYNQAAYQNDNITFIAGISKNQDKYENTNSADTNYDNVFSLYDLNNNVIIHPLFSTTDLCYKSTIQKYIDFNLSIDSSTQFVDIYAPKFENDVIKSCQISSYTYILTDKTNMMPSFHAASLQYNKYNIDGEDTEDEEYVFNLKENQIPTTLYKNSLINGNVSGYFSINESIYDVDYNSVIELPCSFTVFNDFNAGNVFANQIYCKNMYNALYSTDMPTNTDLKNCREYTDIFACGNTLYLKYYDTTNYSIVKSNSNCSNVRLETPTPYSYQKIESVYSLAKYENLTSHRTNMYSITIDNTGLNNLNSSECMKQLKNEIMQDINNNIRKITEKICPLNTQLFDIQIRS